MAEKFYDSDGNECTLEAMCHREPGWAANRIRHERAQLAALRKALAAAEALMQQPSDSGYFVRDILDTSAFDAAMAEVRKVSEGGSGR